MIFETLVDESMVAEPTEKKTETPVENAEVIDTPAPPKKKDYSWVIPVIILLLILGVLIYLKFKASKENANN